MDSRKFGFQFGQKGEILGEKYKHFQFADGAQIPPPGGIQFWLAPQKG